MNCSMARRVLTLLWGAGAGLYPLFSFALGLGDLQVESRLNQPLRARIEVSDVSDEEWRYLRARLATQTPSADGLSKPGLLESVTFKTTEDADHRRLIDVQSAEVFSEPLFDLSIDVLGQGMQVTRNYSVFLDPPGPNDDLPGARGPQLARQALPPPPKQSVVKAPAPSATAATAGSAAAVYSVSKADTLERIARRFGGTNAASRNQFMQWVFQHNSSAFYGDMDHLRAGAQLALPGNAVAATSNLPAAPNARAGATPPAAVVVQNTGDTVVRAQLAGELTSMQQELTGLQKMIAQQDAQIATLKQQIAAREGQQSADESRAAAARASGEETRVAQAGRAQTEESDGERDRAIRTQVETTTDTSEARSAADQAQAQSTHADNSQVPAPEQRSDSAAPTPTEAHSDNTTVESPAARVAAAAAAKSAAQKAADEANRGGLYGLWTRYHLKTSVYYWIAGLVVLAGLLVWLIGYIRWRIQEANPVVDLRYAIGPSFQPAEEPAAKPGLTETMPMIRNSSSGSAAAKLSAALRARKSAASDQQLEHETDHEHEEQDAPQSGLDTWRTQTALLEQDILSETDVLPFVLDTHNQLRPLDEELISPEELTAETPKVAATARTERLPRGLAGGATEKLPQVPTGNATEKLPQVSAGDTDKLPRMGPEDIAALELHDLAANDEVVNGKFAHAKGPKTPKSPAQTVVENSGDLPSERSATNKEIVKALENSLDYQPDRVDIQLKLLEIYHHEALDNRENFHSTLRKLSSLDPKQLSPAQRLHVEMLQRTLHDGDGDGDPGFAVEEEM